LIQALSSVPIIVSDGRLHIAVGVIFNQQKDSVLIARRPETKHQGGLWEFPGGKCKQNEDVVSALKRELFEELNLVVNTCCRLTHVEHDYPNQKVYLDVWSVTDWQGEIFGKEGQLVEWLEISLLGQRNFPAANIAIIEAIASGKYK
jgi:8-oxo-dGTP diphosphatase